MRRKYDIESIKKYKYPNLVAEIMESGYSICAISEYMGHGRRKEDDAFILGKIYGTDEILASEAMGLIRLFNCKASYLFSDELQMASDKPVAYWRHYESNKALEWDMAVFRLSEEVKVAIRKKPYLYKAVQKILDTTEEQLEAE